MTFTIIFGIFLLIVIIFITILERTYFYNMTILERIVKRNVVLAKKEKNNALFSNIPKDINECIELLRKEFTTEKLKEIMNIDEIDFMTKNHHGFGRQIRNGWKLWNKESYLHKYFRNKGIFHADDMSSIIIISFHRKLAGKNIRLEEQVEYYMNYWIKKGKNTIPEDLHHFYFPEEK